MNGRGDIPRQGHVEAGLFAPQQEIREHPALGRAIGAGAARAQAHPRHVAAQLALQEGFRVLPAELEDAQVAEQGEDASRSRGGEIGIRLTRGLRSLQRQTHLLILWFNVYYTSVVKPDVPCRFDAVSTETIALVRLRGRARILRLDALVCPFADRSRRTDRGILDSPGQHAAGRDAPGHRSGPAQGANRGIQAGSHQVSEGVTPLQLVRKIMRGESAQAEILLVEGWNFRQMREALNAHADLKHDSASLSEAQIMTKLGAAEVLPEGMFFPDTYVFAKGSSDLAVLGRARRVMKKQLESAWAGRAPNLPMTDPYEALILASLVEKETGRAGDRTMIAAVFANRLRLKMKLQTDPSVIYGIGEQFDGNLRKRDLVRDTPFNTYTRRGLPPHPIAMPGLASLAAVMHPAQTDALYFVSRGDGTSEFSRTLIEHTRAVAKYQMPGARRRASR